MRRSTLLTFVLAALLGGIAVLMASAQETPEPTPVSATVTPEFAQPVPTAPPADPSLTPIPPPSATPSPAETLPPVPSVDASLTASPTATSQLPTGTPTATDLSLTVMPTPTLGSTAVPWVPLSRTDFEDGITGPWMAGLGWQILPLSSGYALQATTLGSLSINPQQAFNVALEARVQLARAGWSMSIRDSAAGGYTLQWSDAGVISLYRSMQLVGSAALLPPVTADPWVRLRIAAIGGSITVEADGVVLISIADASPLGPGYLSFAAALPAEPDPVAPSVVWVDDLVVAVPAMEWLPTATVTPTPTASAPMPDAPPELSWLQVFEDRFDSLSLNWIFSSLDWTYQPQPDGLGSVLVLTGPAPVLYSVSPIADASIEALVNVSGGGIRLLTHVSPAGGYELALSTSGELQLQRGSVLLGQRLVAGFDPAVPHLLRLSVAGGVLWAEVDGVRQLVAVDPTPLSAGQVGMAAAFPAGAGALTLERVSLYQPAVQVTVTPSLTPTASLTATPMPEEPAWSMVWFSDFEAGPFQLYEELSGDLPGIVRGQQGMSALYARPDLRTFITDRSGDDIAVEGDLTIGRGAFRFEVRRFEDQAYAAEISQTGAQLLRNGVTVATVPLSLPEGMHRFRLSAAQEMIRLHMDGQLLVWYTDPEPLPSGFVTAGTASGSETFAELDNLAILLNQTALTPQRMMMASASATPSAEDLAQVNAYLSDGETLWLGGSAVTQFDFISRSSGQPTLSSVVLPDGYRGSSPAVSPDGDSVAYVCERPSDSFSGICLSQIPDQTGASMQIVEGYLPYYGCDGLTQIYGGTCTEQWDNAQPGGPYLFYSICSSSVLQQYYGENCISVYTALTYFASPSWSPDGNEIVFLRGNRIQVDLSGWPSEDGWQNLVVVNASNTADRELIRSFGPGPDEQLNAENGILSWIGNEIHYLWGAPNTSLQCNWPTPIACNAVAINATTGEARAISNIPETFRPPLAVIQTSRGVMFARVMGSAIEFRFEDASIPTVTYWPPVTDIAPQLVFGPDAGGSLVRLMYTVSTGGPVHLVQINLDSPTPTVSEVAVLPASIGAVSLWTATPPPPLELTLRVDTSAPVARTGETSYQFIEGTSLPLILEVTASGIDEITQPVTIELQVPKGLQPEGMTVTGSNEVNLLWELLDTILGCLIDIHSCSDQVNGFLTILLKDPEYITYRYVLSDGLSLGQAFSINLIVTDASSTSSTFFITGRAFVEARIVQRSLSVLSDIDNIEAPTAEAQVKLNTVTAMCQGTITLEDALTANIRNGPSRDAGIIGTYSNGDTVNILGKNPNGDWYMIEYTISNPPTHTGWIYAQLVSNLIYIQSNDQDTTPCSPNVVNNDGHTATPPPPTPTPDPEACTGYVLDNSGVEVMRSPYGDSGSGSVESGPFRIIARYTGDTPQRNDDWYYVDVLQNSQYGYVSAWLVRTTPMLDSSCTDLRIIDNPSDTSGSQAILQTRLSVLSENPPPGDEATYCDDPSPNSNPMRTPVTFPSPRLPIFSPHCEELRLPYPMVESPLNVHPDCYILNQGYGITEFAYRDPSQYRGTNHIHSGIDIFLATQPGESCTDSGNANVAVAICSGRVVDQDPTAGPTTGNGFWIRCEMPDGSRSNVAMVYNHLDCEAIMPPSDLSVVAGHVFEGIRPHNYPKSRENRNCSSDTSQQPTNNQYCEDNEDDCAGIHLHLETILMPEDLVLEQGDDNLRLNPLLFFSSELIDDLGFMHLLCRGDGCNHYSYYPIDKIYEQGEDQIIQSYECAPYDNDGDYNYISFDCNNQSYGDYDLAIPAEDNHALTVIGDVRFCGGNFPHLWRQSTDTVVAGVQDYSNDQIEFTPPLITETEDLIARLDLPPENRCTRPTSEGR